MGAGAGAGAGTRDVVKFLIEDSSPHSIISNDGNYVARIHNTPNSQGLLRKIFQQVLTKTPIGDCPFDKIK